MLGAAPLSAAESARLKLLFLGDHGHHQPAARFRQLQPTFAERNIALVYTDRVSDLNADTLGRYDGLVLYANIDTIAPQQAQALLDYVASGKGFIPLHCASYCFRNNPEIVALIGAQFQRHGTGEFRVSATEAGRKHPILAGYVGFESWDETYVHTLHNDKNRVVLETRSEGASQEPYTWVRTHGKGRVFYTAWGHDERTWSNPGFLSLVERGARWACGQDPSSVLSFPDRPQTTTLAANLPAFEYVDAKVPYYPAGRKWGTLDDTRRKMQLPVSPAESARHFVLPVGFEAKLFVSEPQLGGKPIAINWDPAGRLWVCETYDYPNELQPEGSGRDRIRICEDTDGDGQADKFTVFAENLSIPSTLTFYRGGVIVQDGVETIYLRDNDGDDKADLRKVLVTGWGLGDTHGGVSNFQYGLDNWYYGMQGYNRSRPKLTDGRETSEFRQGFFRFKVAGEGNQTAVTEIEFLRSTNNNTWGLGISEEGIIFGSTANGNPSEYMPIPNRFYENVRGWSASGLTGIADSEKFKALDESKVRQVDHHGGYTAAAGHALYTARNYPPEYWNRIAFVCEPTGHLVGAFTLSPDGAGFRSKNTWNLLASDDEWAAPTMADVGPDGNIWVVDWYNYIVQHNPTPAGFKTGKGNAYESDLRDKKHGRVYRVVYRGTDPPIEKLDQTNASELFTKGLLNKNALIRRHARRILVENADPNIATLLSQVVAGDSMEIPEFNDLLWTSQGLGVLSGDTITAQSLSALESPSPGIRRNGIATLPRNAAGLDELMTRRVLFDEPHPQVRLAACLALAEMPPSPKAGKAIAEAAFLEPDRGDRWMVDAATCAAAQHDIYFLESLVAANDGPDAGPPLAEAALPNVVAIVAEHYARGAPSETLTGLLVKLAGADPRVAEPIINGLAKGWPKGRSLEVSPEAEAALLAVLPRLSPMTQGVLVNLANRWGNKALEARVGEIAQNLLKVASDVTRSDAERIAAARQLIGFRPGDASAAKELLGLITPRSSAEFSQGMVAAVEHSEAPTAGAAIVDRFGSLTPDVRLSALRALLSRAEWTKALLASAEAGKFQFRDLSLTQQQALASHPDAEIAKRAAKLLASGGGAPNPDRQKVIEEITPYIAQKGNPAAGKALFIKNCAKCHTHSGEGTKIGPDLTGMAVHPKHELLIHILDPSRSVEGNFRVYTVQTDDGRVINGLLASESKTAIELVDGEGKRQTVLRENIDELVASTKSLMPEGFEKQQTPQEINDLLEFLTQRGRYTPIPLDRVATAISTRGMFYSEDSEVERLIFADWSPKTFEGVPFLLVNPDGAKRANVVLLHGPAGTIPPKMPKVVTLPCNSPAKTIHLLSGVSGWGFPGGQKGSITMIVRLRYAGGATEEHPLRNGEEFADYIRRIDVPSSKFAFALRGQQIRYLTVTPERPDLIETIELVKGSDNTAPVVMAVTVETNQPGK
jgi:putative membrane-bound dehydrogenase-like protein